MIISGAQDIDAAGLASEDPVPAGRAWPQLKQSAFFSHSISMLTNHGCRQASSPACLLDSKQATSPCRADLAPAQSIPVALYGIALTAPGAWVTAAVEGRVRTTG